MDIKLKLAKLISARIGISSDDVFNMLEIPDDSNLGDYALPCFKLSKVLKSSPVNIAKDLCEKIEKPDNIGEIQNLGGYLNFFLNRDEFIKNTLSDDLFSKKPANGKTICIDFSSINIAKPFHIGHLLTTVIGNALYKVFDHLGYNVVGINHLGDFGTQFGKLITAYKLWGNEEDVNKNRVRALMNLYVKYHDEAEKNPELDDISRAWFKKIETGDGEANEIFNWFRDLTLCEVNEVYKRLNVHFDYYQGESFYSDKMQPVIDELKSKDLLEYSEGAYVVNLERFDLPPCMIIKSDGATLYSTRDLAAAFYRKQTFDFYKCLYVVAYQQNLHFKQLFSVIDLMGYPWAKDLEHVAFGMVSLESGTLSTRRGNVVFLDDVLSAAVEKTLSVIMDKNPDLPNKEEVAENIGVGAIIFGALYSSRIKDMVFNWENALNFDGETAPYMQYTHARCCSLLKKAGEIIAPPDYSCITTPLSFAIAKLLSSFDSVLNSVAEKYEPYLLSRYLVELSQAFNKYYFETRIIDETDPCATSARLKLVEYTKTAIKTGLSLLGIESPSQM